VHTSAAATTWVPTLGSGISCPSRAIALSKTIAIDAPGSGGLSRARRDGIIRFAARGVHGLQSTGAVSCHTPWPDACARVGVWFWADARAADSSAAAPRQSATEVSRIGMAGISFVVSLGRGGKSFALSAGPKVLSHAIPSKARWAINGRRSRDQGAPGGRLKRSAWNGTDGIGPQAAAS
jgi:hypothetical protein